MRKLVLTSRFKRSLRKFIKNDQNLQARIEEALQQMEIDLFASNLATHQLKGEFDGLRACSCGYDCRIIVHAHHGEFVQCVSPSIFS